MLFYIVVLALGAMGLGLLHSGAKVGHTGPTLAGLACIAGALGAVMFGIWWPIAVGFASTWVIRGICGDPSEDPGLPLHGAVVAYDMKKAARLLTAGTDVHATNDRGQTALDLAVALKYTDMEQLLRSHAARDFAERPPPHEAIAEPLTEAPLPTRFAQEGHFYNKDGFPVLNIAVGKRHSCIVANLLADGADVNATDPRGHTPLHCARDGEIVVMLIEHGAEIEPRNAAGNTPLHLAAVLGRKDAAALLLEHGANVHARGCEYETPLHCAACFGHLAVADLLLTKGADIEAVSANGRTPLRDAGWGGKRDVGELLRAMGAVLDIFSASGLGLRAEVAAFLRADEKSAQAHDQDGRTPLHYAAVHGHLGTARLLLAHGAYVNACDTDGWTPLHWTAEDGEKEMIRLLLASGANDGAETEDGDTPLDLANVAENEEVCELLLHGREKGDPEELNVQGNDLGRQGRFREAITKYDEAIRFDPSYHEPWHNRGKAKLNLEDFSGAVADLTKAMELAPDPSAIADALNNRGIARKKSGDLRGAADDYTRALQHNPGLHRVYLNRGIALYELGDTDGATVDFKTAAEHGIAEASEALRQLGAT